ncbi:MAG: hypothetical protein ABSH22_10190 [Tepidisphaeraceae bacterium]|jgi:hypothetical protein
MTSGGPSLQSRAAPLAWAVFLGASWTWCIGMFLPVLLVRDFGAWAWVVFAVPNVIGAAAMAWVLPDASASRAMVRRHALACEWFSIVTLSFHAFFYASFIREIAGPPQMNWLVLFAVLAVLMVVRNGDLLAAALVTATSVVAAVVLFNRGVIPRFPAAVAPGPDLFYVALVCTFGLMLCPYLDLTFHQARQSTSPAGGRVAFAVGFGVVFLAMIVFTLSYTGWLAHLNVPLGTIVAVPLGIHLVAQTMLKLVLHGKAVVQRRNLPGLMEMAVVVVMAALFGMFCLSTDFSYRGLSLAEIGYRCFMAFYGLVFPAYVWICIFGRGRLSTWLAAVIVAMPMYWLAYIERQMVWLVPGVAIVVLAGFMPKGQPKMRLTTD